MGLGMRCRGVPALFFTLIVLALVSSLGEAAAPRGQTLTVSVPSPAIGTVTVTARVSKGDGSTSVIIFIDSTAVTSCAQSPCSYSWNTRTTTNGTHAVSARAQTTQRKKNGPSTVTSTTVKTVVQNDWTSPTVSVDAPSAASGQVTINVAASDASGIAGIDLLLDGAVLATYSTPSGSTTWDTTKVADGPHVLQATATDAWGNVGSSAPLTVTVSNPAPVAVNSGSGQVATITLGAGWATFGQAVPQGVATDGLQIAALPTQTDVKTRWADGSIKFAVVSAYVPAAGSYDVTASPATPGGFAPVVADTRVTFTIGSQLYVATLPAPSSDYWLAGPIVQEWRSVVAPVANGVAHPFLRVVFDVRAYADGANRIDMTVENVLNVAGATAVTYDVALTVNGQQVFQRSTLAHYWMTRWRKTFSTSTLADVTPDFEPFFGANALPRYLSIVTEQPYSTAGSQFGLLGGGDFLNPMNDHGGRPELAPYPDWVARYLVHAAHASGPATKAYMLAMGEQAGAWPMHIREADGTLVSIDAKPYFWLDTRCETYLDPAPHVATCPQGNMRARGPLAPEPNNHQPSIGFASYLVTGDRFFLDEMRFWANYTLIGTYEDAYSNHRGGGWTGGSPGEGTYLYPGSRGLLFDFSFPAPGFSGNEVRGIAWGLRTLADAAAWLPDADALKPYFTEKVANNLAYMDAYAAAHTTPLGTYFDSPDFSYTVWSIFRYWQNNYVAWAIDRASQHGFTGGLTLRDKLARLTLKLFTSDPEYPQTEGAPYELVIGAWSGGAPTYYTSLGDVYLATNTLQSTAAMFVPFQGWYGVDARLALMIGVAQGWAGAQSAYDYLYQIIGVEPYVDGVSDLANRAGWAIE